MKSRFKDWPIKRLLLTLGIVLCFLFVLLTLAIASIFGSITESEGERLEVQVKDEDATGFIFKGTSRYSDLSTIQELDRAFTESDERGQKTFKQLISEGRIWSEPYHMRVRMGEENKESQALQVHLAGEVPDSEMREFWIRKDDHFPRTHSLAGFAMDWTKMVRRENYSTFLDGHSTAILGSYEITHFASLVDGLYEGVFTEDQAKSTLSMPDALIGREVFFEFRNVIKDRLIYSVGDIYDTDHAIALVRDESLESNEVAPADFYESLRTSGIISNDPILQGGLVFEGFEQFTTSKGILRQLPVFRMVNVQP